MYYTSATIGSIELEDPFGEIDAENIDFHDEPPYVKLTYASVSLREASGPSH